MRGRKKEKNMLDCNASIVAYNTSPEMLKTAVKSFLNCSLKTNLCVVDNSPQPYLKDSLDGLPVEYHFSDRNVGYGKAHNWAIEHSKESRYHLIMNPDIVIEAGTLEKLVDFMDENQDIGMVCPRVVSEDGTVQYLNKRYPRVQDFFVRRFIPRIFHHLFKKSMDRYEMRDVGYEKICDVEAMSGAFMFCRSNVLKDLKGFDPRYFLYFEDFDLSHKFQQAGYRTVYYPNAKIIHFWERAAHKNIGMTFVFITNMCRYFNKWGWTWV